jgi:hypothetical protein
MTKKEEQDFDYDKRKTSVVTRHMYSATVEIPKALGISFMFLFALKRN